MAGPDGLVGGLGGQPRVGVVDRDERMQRRVAPADPLEQRLDDVDRRQRLRLERPGQLRDRCPHRIDRRHLSGLPRRGDRTIPRRRAP